MPNLGRPLKFNSPVELGEMCDEYFKLCDERKEPYTITGLALHLDTSRETLLDYEDNRPDFSDTVKKAKAKCENYVEKYLFTGKNVVGAIFNLKNNYRGWKDKQETELTGNVTIQTIDEYGNQTSAPVRP